MRAAGLFPSDVAASLTFVDLFVPRFFPTRRGPVDTPSEILLYRESFRNDDRRDSLAKFDIAKIYRRFTPFGSLSLFFFSNGEALSRYRWK